MRSGYAFDWEFDLERAAVWNAGRTACTLTVEGYPENDYGRKVELVYRFTKAEWKELLWMYDSNYSQDAIEGYIDDRLVLVRDLDPGEGMWAWSPGPARSGNRRAKDMPRCPKCSEKMHAVDMKTNGVDEFGCYYEAYKCPGCLAMFSVTYDGPDDTGDWTVDSYGRKPGKKRSNAKRVAKASSGKVRR